MIPLALLLAAAPAEAGPPDPRSPRARFEQCVQASDSNPVAAETIAAQWAAAGGGVPAAQCLGIARSAGGDWRGAADAFGTAADLADQTHDGRAANLWVSAGNAALAGGDFAGARASLSKAIASPFLSEPLKGEAYLDRARADVAIGDTAAARSDMNQALKLVPDDPMGWLLSATLARRMGDTTRAAADIKEAGLRAPNASDILYEAGNIAAASGDMDGARLQWTRAVTAEPDSDAAKRAKAELAAAGASIPATTQQDKPAGR